MKGIGGDDEEQQRGRMAVYDCIIGRKDSHVFGDYPVVLMHDLLRPICKAYVNQSAPLFHCLLLYAVSPLDHHLYSSVCSEAISGAFHDRIVFRKLSESARDYNHNQLVYGVQECYGSIMVQYGNVFILVDEDYFRHQQFFVAVMIPY